MLGRYISYCTSTVGVVSSMLISKFVDRLLYDYHTGPTPLCTTSTLERSSGCVSTLGRTRRDARKKSRGRVQGARLYARILKRPGI
jgi:hypothetical protein